MRSIFLIFFLICFFFTALTITYNGDVIGPIKDSWRYLVTSIYAVLTYCFAVFTITHPTLKRVIDSKPATLDEAIILNDKLYTIYSIIAFGSTLIFFAYVMRYYDDSLESQIGLVLFVFSGLSQLLVVFIMIIAKYMRKMLQKNPELKAKMEKEFLARKDRKEKE